MKITEHYESPQMEMIVFNLGGYPICISGNNGYVGEGDDLADMFNI